MPRRKLTETEVVILSHISFHSYVCCCHLFCRGPCSSVCSSDCFSHFSHPLLPEKQCVQKERLYCSPEPQVNLVLNMKLPAFVGQVPSSGTSSAWGGSTSFKEILPLAVPVRVICMGKRREEKLFQIDIVWKETRLDALTSPHVLGQGTVNGDNKKGTQKPKSSISHSHLLLVINTFCDVLLRNHWWVLNFYHSKWHHRDFQQLKVLKGCGD